MEIRTDFSDRPLSRPRYCAPPLQRNTASAVSDRRPASTPERGRHRSPLPNPHRTIEPAPRPSLAVSGSILSRLPGWDAGISLPRAGAGGVVGRKYRAVKGLSPRDPNLVKCLLSRRCGSHQWADDRGGGSGDGRGLFQPLTTATGGQWRPSNPVVLWRSAVMIPSDPPICPGSQRRGAREPIASNRATRARLRAKRRYPRARSREQRVSNLSDLSDFDPRSAEVQLFHPVRALVKWRRQHSS
jgi:hypothetical protein